MRRRVLQPPSLIEVLAEIAILKDDQFKFLSDQIRDIDSFDTDRSRLKRISSQTNIDVDNLRLIMNGLAYLYKTIHRVNIEPQKLSEVVGELLDTLLIEEGIENHSAVLGSNKIELISRLEVLLQKTDTASNYAKYERLRWGFLPVILAAESFVDLRPNFSDDLNSIDELIPLVQFNLVTDSPNETYRNIVFQVDARALEVLKKAVERAEEKLKKLNDINPINEIMTKRRLKKK